MNSVITVTLQTGLAFAAYILIYQLYMRDKLNALSFRDAVIPLLIIHIFRYIGLTLLAPGQVDPQLPVGALLAMGFGDYISGVFAFIAAIAMIKNSKIGPSLVGVFSIIGIADFINIIPTAITNNVFSSNVGAMWIVLVLFPPVLLMSHFYIISRLIQHTMQEKSKT